MPAEKVDGILPVSHLRILDRLLFPPIQKQTPESQSSYLTLGSKLGNCVHGLSLA